VKKDAGPAKHHLGRRTARTSVTQDSESRASDSGSAAPDWREGLPLLVMPGVTLRELRLSDATSLSRSLIDPATWRFTSSPPAGVAGFEAFIGWMRRERRAGCRLVFGIVPDGQEDAVGFILIRRLDGQFHTGQIGLALGDAFQETALAARSAEAAVDFAFRELRPHRLEARTLDSREDGILWALGATREGLLRASWHAGGRVFDETLWSLLRAEWIASPRRATCRREVTLPEPEEMPVAPVTAAEAQSVPPWGPELPVLAAAGVTLREIEAGDAEPLLRALSPEDLRACFDPPLTTLDLLQRFIAWIRGAADEGRAACFVVLAGDGREPVGIVQVRRLDPRFVTAEWGIALSGARRGTGLFGRVTRLMMPFIFDTIGVRRLEAQTSGSNAPAAGSLKALGGAREARLRSAFAAGEDSAAGELWAILDRDWRAARDTRR
jgi:ribosomal-protein-alanine N-acetyltransferase